MLEYIQITVQGKVQGVSFRHYTEKKALELNLKGKVKNLMNGDVEIIVSGEKNNINQLIKWCHTGSPSSQVNNILIKHHPLKENFNTFKTIY